MDSVSSLTCAAEHRGQGERPQPPVINSPENSTRLGKFLDMMNGKFVNKVGDVVATVASNDFPPEVPTESYSNSVISDSGEFDEWLMSTNNFFIKPQKNPSPTIQLAGLQSVQSYDVCNTKNGVVFTLAKTSTGMPIYKEYGVMSVTDPINYTLINQMGNTVMNICGRDYCGLSNKVDLFIKGTNRGYMSQSKKGSIFMCNKSDQLLFRFVTSGSVNVIFMGDEPDNESKPIGEIFGSARKIYKLSIETILPAPLKAMLLGACIVLMHHKQFSPVPGSQCILQKPSVAFAVFAVFAVMIIISLVAFR